MKKALLIAYFTLALAFATGQGSPRCESPGFRGRQTMMWRDMEDPCREMMMQQVDLQMTSAVTYLAMGAHFIRATINRPGFADMFFSSANAKRANAVDVIRYLLQRGELTNNMSSLFSQRSQLQGDWDHGVSALQDALRIETLLTKSIRNIASVCQHQSDRSNDDASNDLHVVNYLKNGLLRDQYNNQRDLAGKIQVLGQMMDTHGALGEFLFDKKLLDGVSFYTTTSFNGVGVGNINGVSLYTSTNFVSNGNGNGNTGSNGNGNGNGNSGTGSGNSGDGNGNGGNNGGGSRFF